MSDEQLPSTVALADARERLCHELGAHANDYFDLLQRYFAHGANKNVLLTHVRQFLVNKKQLPAHNAYMAALLAHALAIDEVIVPPLNDGRPANRRRHTEHLLDGEANMLMTGVAGTSVAIAPDGDGVLPLSTVFALPSAAMIGARATLTAHAAKLPDGVDTEAVVMIQRGARMFVGNMVEALARIHRPHMMYGDKLAMMFGMALRPIAKQSTANGDKNIHVAVCRPMMQPPLTVVDLQRAVDIFPRLIPTDRLRTRFDARFNAIMNDQER